MGSENIQPGDDNSDRFQKLREKAARAEAEIMKKNIYKRGTFESLVKVADEVQGIADETHLDFKRVIEEAGIQDPAAMLDRSMSHWDKMLAVSKIPSEEKLIENLRDQFQLQLTQSSEIFIPTDELESVHSDGEETREKEGGEDANRVGMALETLLHLELGGQKIAMDDLVVTVGRIPDHSWRMRPYWLINIAPLKIAVFVNNQYANRTFVVPYKTKKDLTQLEAYTKEQLKALGDRPDSLVHHFVFEDEERFKSELADSVQKVFEMQEMLKPYKTYEEAKKAVQALRIKSFDDYRQQYKKDPRLPAKPKRKYGDAFLGWGDFLGTGAKSPEETSLEHYQIYDEAKAAAQALGIKGQKEYQNRHKENPLLPSSPHRKYGDAFLNWGDFLGTGKSNSERAKEFYQSYEEARTAAQALGIKNRDDYNKRYKEDPRLPSNPNKKYKNNFTTWGDFLGKK